MNPQSTSSTSNLNKPNPFWGGIGNFFSNFNTPAPTPGTSTGLSPIPATLAAPNFDYARTAPPSSVSSIIPNGGTGGVFNSQPASPQKPAAQPQGNTSQYGQLGLSPERIQQLQNYWRQPDLSTQGGALAQGGVAAPGNIGSIGFQVPPTGTVNGSDLTHSTMGDATAAYNQYAQSAQSGAITPTPTDKYMQQVFNASSYSPQEQDALQQYASVTNRINEATLAERRQIQSLQENGSISKDQASAFVTESQRRSDQQLADLAVQQSGASLSLGVLGQLRGNNLTALQNLSPFYNPQQVAPGSTLANAQGQNFFQGNGASPQTIMSTAQSLEASAQSSGTLQYLPDGTIDHNAYIQQAQHYYNSGAFGGGIGNGGMAGNQGGINGNASQQGNSQSQSLPYQFAISAGLSPNLAGAVNQSPVTGDYYISGDKIPDTQKGAAITQGGLKGIAYVPSANIGNIQQLDIAIGQMQQLAQLAPQYLSSGLLGRLKGFTTNQIQTLLQTDPGWAKFNSVRLQAIDYLKGLAQGGGFRTTQSEIDTAANSLFSTTDNLESAQSKMETAMKNINLAYREYLPTHKDTPLLGGQSSTSSQSAGGATPSSGNSIWNF